MMKLLPETEAEKKNFFRRSLIEGVVAAVGLGFLAAPSVTPSLPNLSLPELKTDEPEYVIGGRTSGLSVFETPESGSVKFFAGRREEYEFDLRLGLIFDHSAGRMYDLRHTQPPADLLTAYSSLKQKFCARHADNIAIEPERRAVLCPQPPPQAASSPEVAP